MTLKNISADVVMVSDIHIIEPNDERARNLEQLIDFLITSDVKVFLLIGDIFDFILEQILFLINALERLQIS